MDKQKLSYLLVNHRWVNSKGLKWGLVQCFTTGLVKENLPFLTLTFNLLHLRSKKKSRAELMKALMTSLVRPQIYKNILFKAMVLLLLQGFGSEWCGFFVVTSTTERSFPCALCTAFMSLCECIIKVQKQFNCLLPQTSFMRWPFGNLYCGKM